MRLKNIITEKKENTGIVEYFADLVRKHEPKDLLGKMFTPYYGRIGLYNQYKLCTAGYAYDAYGFWYDARGLKGIDDSDAPPTYMKLRHGMIVGIGWSARIPSDISRFWDYVEEGTSFHRRGEPAYYSLDDDNKTIRTQWYWSSARIGEQKSYDVTGCLDNYLNHYYDNYEITGSILDFDDRMVLVIRMANEMYDNGHLSGELRVKYLTRLYNIKVVDYCYDKNKTFVDEWKERFDREILPLINDESRP